MPPRPPLPAIFADRFDFDDERSRRPLWQRFQATGDVAAFHALVIAYLPLLTCAVRGLKRRRPEFYIDDIEELLSDGVLALITEIRRSDVPGGAVFNFCVLRGVRKAVRIETTRRHFAGSRIRAHTDSVLASIRADLTQSHGRIPTPEEMTEALRPLITNPHIAIGNETRSTWSLRGSERAGQRSVPELVMDAEFMRVVRAVMGEQDRVIIEMVLRGENNLEIARAIGLDGSSAVAVRNRINGALWAARSNVRLAAYLGIEPHPPVAGHRGHVPGARGVAAAPAAKRAIADRLAEQIDRGELRPGEKLPTLQVLSEKHGVSVTTVSKAYDALKRRGYIERVRGGHYVAHALPARRRIAM